MIPPRGVAWKRERGGGGGELLVGSLDFGEPGGLTSVRGLNRSSGRSNGEQSRSVISSELAAAIGCLFLAHYFSKCYLTSCWMRSSWLSEASRTGLGLKRGLLVLQSLVGFFFFTLLRNGRGISSGGL